MHVSKLQLDEFRNYARLELALRPASTLLVGSNGQGKTNLVEALVYASSSSSHRVSSDAPLVRAGSTSAVIRADITHAERTITIEIEINASGSNRTRINGSPVRARDLAHSFRTVVFAPEDLILVRGDPGSRRRFLDTVLVQLSPRMSGVLADYDRVVKQRSTLLKSLRGVRSPDLGTLDVWDDRLVSLGVELMRARRELVASLTEPAMASYGAIAGCPQPVRLSMVETASRDAVSHADAELADDFRLRLRESRSAEIERGSTLVGPHRDELLVELNDLPARVTASQGESWSLALALKIATAQLLRVDSPAGDPVIILDDVFAELDAHRRDRLTSAIGDFEQILVTAAVAADVPPSFTGRSVRISEGTVVEDSDD